MVREYSNRSHLNSFNYLVWVQWQSASIDPATLFAFHGVCPVCGNARTVCHIAHINHVVWVAWKGDAWCCMHFVGASYSSKLQIQIEIRSFQSISKGLSSSPISLFLHQCTTWLSKQNGLERTDSQWRGMGRRQAAKQFNTNNRSF